MISVIICSLNPELLSDISENIKQTIGVPFEIIAINNSNGEYGICKAYNTGASKAIYDILCFTHEDVFFETKNWGLNVIHHLKDPSVGLIGVVGGDTLCKIPSYYATETYGMEMNIIVNEKFKGKLPEKHTKTTEPNNNSVIKAVLIVDGVWMCTRRDVYEKFKFDAHTFSGFHAYDFDFSLQVFSAYKVCVVFDILMQHYSVGTPDHTYINQHLKLCEKWKNKLPVSSKQITEEKYRAFHWNAMEHLLKKMNEFNYKLPNILKVYLKFSANRFFKLPVFIRLLGALVTNRLKPG